MDPPPATPTGDHTHRPAKDPAPAAHLLLRLDEGLHASLTVLGSQGARLAPVAVVR